MKTVAAFLLCGFIFISSVSLAAEICDEIKKRPADREIVPDGPESKLLSMCRIMPEAEAGDVTKQFYVGVYYWNTENYEEAFKWFDKSVQQGNPTAQWLLGILYRDGKGVTQDYAQAFKLISQSVEQGNTAAQHDLSELYAKGQGVEKNLEEAFFWVRLSNYTAEVYNEPMTRSGPEKERELREKLSPAQIEAVEARVRNSKSVKKEK